MTRAREKSNTRKNEHSVGVEWCDHIKVDLSIWDGSRGAQDRKSFRAV